jgi:hypothetical protein
LLALGALAAHQGCGEIEISSPEQVRGRVGAFFFSWHDCQPNARATREYPYKFGPADSCDQKEMLYHPLAMSGAKGFPYSARSLAWYVDELQQMKLAGVDYVLPVYWGDHPQLKFFSTENVAHLVWAIDHIGSDLKIGLFDDTTSEVAQWNLDNGRQYLPSPAMNLADQSLWRYFYDDKILRFFRTVPKRMWATHDGQPVEAGGRPIIVTWIAEADAHHPNGPSFFSYHGAAASLWHHIKTRFLQDFGVEPFLIFETSWYQKSPDLGNIGDAQYSWGAAAFHSIWHEHKGYVVSSVGPGYDDHMVRKSSPRVRSRSLTHDEHGAEQLGDSLAFFRNEYLMDRPIPGWPHHGVRADSDLVLVETWNELYEGTGIEAMSDWPDLQRPGQSLQPETYLRALRELKKDRPGYRDYDHTIVSTRKNDDGTWTFELRNDGAKTWKSGETSLGFRIHDASGKKLHEGLLAPLPGDVAFDQSVLLTFPQPVEWTDQARFPQAAVVLDLKSGEQWFTNRGDGFLIRPVTIGFPGFF